MTAFDWDKHRRDKEALHARYTALPFRDKLQLLNRLYERDELVGAERRQAPPASTELSSTFLTAPEQRAQTTQHVFCFTRIGAADVLIAATTSSPRGTSSQGTSVGAVFHVVS